MGCVRRIQSGVYDPADLARAMEKSAHQAERAGKIIARVREFVRTRTPQREAQDLNAIIIDTAELVEIESEKHKVRIEFALHPTLPPAFADRVMIEQVLLNLFKNAIESMLETPRAARVLRVSTSVIEPLNGDAASQVMVRVQDQGHGLSSDVQAALFSPFFSTKPQGMGMGLNICRSIIELHDGHLSFANNDSHEALPADSAVLAQTGTTFSFTLPIHQSQHGTL